MLSNFATFPFILLRESCSMANMKTIKSQISSVSNIQQITKALEIVATVKLQKVKQQAEEYREFMIEFLRIVQVINSKTNIFNKEDRKKTGKNLIIVTGTNKGLCGSLNSKLFKQVFTEFKSKKDSTDVFCIGKKTLEFFSRSNFNVVGTLDIKDEFAEEDLTDLYNFMRSALENREYDNVTIYFNFFKNAISQVPLSFNLFPLDKKSFENFTTELGIDMDELITEDLANKELTLEPSPYELAKEMRKQLLQHMVYGAILQNKTGEFAARMVAMKNAKDNSSSLIKDLKLSFNKARQGMITQEISEIVGAKMAIEG